MSSDVSAEFYALRDEANALLAEQVWDASATDELSYRMADFLKEYFNIDNWTTSSQAKVTGTATDVLRRLNKLVDKIL